MYKDRKLDKLTNNLRTLFTQIKRLTPFSSLFLKYNPTASLLSQKENMNLLYLQAPQSCYFIRAFMCWTTISQSHPHCIFSGRAQEAHGVGVG